MNSKFITILSILFFINCQIVTARPPRPPPKEGEIRNFKGQRHFSYDNSHLKETTIDGVDRPIFQYDIEIAENFHSLDEEEYIEKVECGKNTLDVYATNEEIASWKLGDVLYGSEMWRCYYPISRKIKFIEFDGKENELFHYFIETEDAKLEDYFENAEMKYIFPEDYDFNDKNLNDENNNLKEAIVEVDNVKPELISPMKGDLIDTARELEIQYNINGCNYLKCGTFQTTIEVVVNGNVNSGNKQMFTDSCSCGFASCHCKTSIKLTDKIYRNADQKNKYTNIQFILTFQPEKGIIWDVVIPKLESDFFEVNTYKMEITEPKDNVMIEFGNKTYIKWNPTHTLLKKFTYIKLDLFKRETDHSSEIALKDTLVTSFDKIRLSDGKYELDCSKQPFTVGQEYIVKITMKDDYHSETMESGSILILPNDKMNIISPHLLTYYGAEKKSIEVEWEYSDILSFTKANVYLYLQGTKKPITTKTDVEIPSNKTTLQVDCSKVESSSNYYIEMTFYPDDNKQKDKVKIHSDTFSIATDRYFKVSTEYEELSKELIVTCEARLSVGEYHVSVNGLKPSIFSGDEKMSGTTELTGKPYNSNNKNDQNKIQTFVFKIDDPSPFKQYVNIWHKVKGTIRNKKHEERHFFMESIPKEKIFHWNYNEVTKSYQNETQPLFDLTCESNDSDKLLIKAFKKVCEYKIETPFEFSMTTSKSYLYFPIKMRDFQLSINQRKIFKAGCHIEGQLDVDIDLTTTFKTSLEVVNGQIPIAPSIGLKIPITLGIIPFVCGLDMTPNVGLSVNVDAMIQINTKYKKNMKFVIDMNSLNNIKPIDIKHDDLSEGSSLQTTLSGSISTTIEPFFAMEFELGFGIGTSFDIAFNFVPVLGFKIDAIIQSSLFKHKDEDTDVEKNYLMKLEYGPHLYFTLGMRIGSYNIDITEKQIIEDKYNKKRYLLERNVTKHKIKVSLRTKKEYSSVEMIAFQNEIGRVTKLFKEDFNPFNVYLEKSKTSSGKYYVVFMNETIDETTMKKVKKCILGQKCEKTIKDSDFHFIPPSTPTSTKREVESEEECNLPYCDVCSLDETYCEQCQTNYKQNDVKLCVPTGEKCDFPSVYDNGKCNSCEGTKVYNSFLDICEECPEGSVFKNNQCVECDDPETYNNQTKTCITCTGAKQYPKNGTCLECQEPGVIEDGNCVYCEYPLGYLEGKCTECKKPYYWDNYKCIKCDNGLYLNNDTLQCMNCSGGHVIDNLYCIFCEPDQEFLNGKCQDCKSGTGFNPETKKCETCPQYHYTKNSYCEYCEGIIKNNECYSCSSEKKIINNEHTKCISCNEKLPGSGYYNGGCIICEEGEMINNNGICERCPENHILYLGKCVKCPSDSKYDEEMEYCRCTDGKKWFNGEKCVDGSEVNMEYDQTKKSLKCKEGFGMMYIYDKYQCMKCEDYGFTEHERQCVCLDQDHYLHYDKCLRCEKDMLGKVVERKDENFATTNLSYKECVCEGEGKGWDYTHGTYKCIECSKMKKKSINGSCECIEENGLALLRNGLCIDCKSSGGLLRQENENINCNCPSGKGFIELNGEVKCVKCEDYNYDNDNGYCICGGYRDSKAGIVQQNGKCLKCNERGAEVKRDSSGYYHCMCPTGKNWDKNKLMCVKSQPLNNGSKMLHLIFMMIILIMMI